MNGYSRNRHLSVPRLLNYSSAAPSIYFGFARPKGRIPPFNEKEVELAMQNAVQLEVSRRDLLTTSVAAIALTGTVVREAAAQSAVKVVYTSNLSLTVNGDKRELDLDNRTTLLDALREHLHLTGTKKGCDHGQCGACTVIVDGRRIYSCSTLAVMHDGGEVTTIEGLGKPGDLHPMQAAFVKHDGFQCGYCTPVRSVPPWPCSKKSKRTFRATLPAISIALRD